MSRHNGRKRRKHSARRRASHVEKRSTNSTPGETPGNPSVVEKVADFVNTPQPTEGDENIVDGAMIDAERLLGDVAGDSVGDLRELLDHLRAPPAKVSNGESSGNSKVQPAKIGRPVVFDERTKSKVLGLITAGVNQATAAAYVGVARSTITKALRRDPEFAREVAQAQAAANVHPLINIIKHSGRSFTAARYLYEKVQPRTDLSEEEAKAEATQREADGESRAQQHTAPDKRVCESFDDPKPPSGGEHRSRI